MPYIKKEDRPAIDFAVTALAKVARTDGELNYALTTLLDTYAETEGRCYMTYNSIIGILECVKLEYYRKRIAPYEETKEKLNGRVFE